MNCSMQGFPVLHHLLVCSNSCSLSWWCHPTTSPSVASFSSCSLSFPASGSFPMSHLFTSSGQSIGAWASAPVLPMNIQGWFHLGLTGLSSLLSKGCSRVFSSTIIWKHQFCMFNFLYVECPLSEQSQGGCLYVCLSVCVCVSETTCLSMVWKHSVQISGGKRRADYYLEISW